MELTTRFPPRSWVTKLGEDPPSDLSLVSYNLLPAVALPAHGPRIGESFADLEHICPAHEWPN